MRGITRTLGVCSAVFLLAASAHAEVMYFNPLAGNTSGPEGTYGSITVSDALRATTFGAEQSIFNTGRYGTPAGMLAKSGDNKFVNRHTVMGWFKVEAETLPTNQLLWYTGNEAGKDLQGYSVKVTSDGKLSFQRCRTGTGADASAPQTLATTAGKIAPKTWFHVALVVDATNATRDNATVKFYLNGEEVVADTRDVRLNGANVCTMLQVAQGVSASTFYVDTAALDASAIRARAANTFVRTLGSTGNWTIASNATDWDPGVAGTSPTSGYVMVMVPQDSTLTMDASPSLTNLLIAGTNAGTNALTLAANSGSLTSETTKVETNTDVSAITASLGAVTIASGKELTVNNFSQYNSLAAGSTIGVNVKTTTPLEMGAANVANISKLVVRSGTVKSLISGQFALAHNRAIEVTGASANLVINEKDGTGWEASNGSIAVRNGAKLTYNKRDTLRTPVTLCQGTVELGSEVAGTDDHRAMDLYLGGGNNWTVEAKEGATVDAPTESSLKALGTGTNRKILIRNGDWNINVAEKAQMTVDADLDTTSIATNTANGDRGALVKTGAGVLILKGNNSAYDKNTQINGGTVKLTNGATLGTGTATVASGATLEVVTVAETPRAVLANTLTNNGNYVISGNGVATLGSARTLPVTSIVSPAKVRVTKQADEERAIQIATQLEEITWTNDNMPFEVVDSDGNSVTTYGGKVTADGVVQIELIDSSSLPTATLSAETTNTLSGLLWNTSLINTKGAVINTGTGIDAVTLVLDTALTTVPTSILITGTAPLTINRTGSATLANVVIDAGTAVTVATPSAFGSAVEVNGTLIVDCATALVESETVISGFGKLIKRGGYDLVLTATANHTFAGGTDIEEGKIGLRTGALGTGPIALKGTEDAPAGLWLWANAAVTVANDVELSGSAEFYIPHNRTLTLSGTVSGTGAAKVTTANGTGELRFSNVAVSKCTYTGTWTIPASTTLRFGDASAGGSNALTANSTCSVGSEVIVEERGTLIVNPWTGDSRSKGGTGKVTLTTKVTLNGGTLTMPDGSYVYNALNVTAASTVSATHNKGVVFKTFYGSGDLTVKALSSAYGCPLFAFWWPNAAGDSNSVEYTGKITFKSEANTSPVMQVVPDTTISFKQAYLHFEGSNTIEMLMGGGRSVGALDGNAQVTIKSSDDNNQTLTIGADYTGTAASEPFAGKIADSVNLTLAANVAQTITGSLGTVTDGVASYARAVTLNAGSELKLQSTTAQTITGALSGTGALTIGDGTNTSAVTLTNAEAFTGSVAIKNVAMLVLNAANTGTKVLGDYSATKNNRMTLEPGSKLQLQGGRCFPYVTGTGTIEVTGDFYFGVSDNNGTLDASNIDIVVNAKKTLTFYDYNRTYTLVAKSLVVNGTLAKDGAGNSKVTIATGKSLSGTGTINLPLTFESGATLDASGATADGCLTLGSVTMPPEGTVSLTLPATGSDGLAVVKCTSPSPSTVLERLSATPPAGYLLGTTDAAVVLKQPTLPSGSGSDSGALSSGAAAALREVAAAAELTSVTAVTGSTTVNGTPTTLTAEAIDNALAVFGKSVVTVDGTELKVDYNFGIVAIEPNGLNGPLPTFTVKVAVKKADGTLASIAEGVSVKLVDGAGKTIEDGYKSGFQDLDNDGIYEAYFSADPTAEHTLIGRSFKVKATK